MGSAEQERRVWEKGMNEKKNILGRRKHKAGRRRQNLYVCVRLRERGKGRESGGGGEEGEKLRREG